MSSPLAIGAVSAVLRNLLDNGVVDVGPAVGSVKVTAVAPDSIKLDQPNASPSLNLFMYRVTSNQGWRNTALPSFNGDGSRQTSPPLALDLHYLLTAYGSSDFQAEILLGYGMHILHERAVLDRAAIRRALSPSPLGSSILPPAFVALAASDLADQAEALTVTLETTDTEEMSRLWSAMQAHYRPTATYVVSVVLIESTKPTRTPLPVLSRNLGVEPSLLPPFPTITAVVPDADQLAARLGEPVRLEGHHLDGTSVVVSFSHPLLSAPHTITVGTNADRTGVEVTLPSGATADQQWPAGLWTVTVALVRPGEIAARTSTVGALLLAPRPDLPPMTMTRNATTGALTVTLAVHPQARPSQQVRLALGGDLVLADAHPAATGSLTFHFGAVPAGPQWLRLVVDGVESHLLDRSDTPPVFDATQRVTVPA